jgi:hypothetical protein
MGMRWAVRFSLKQLLFLVTLCALIFGPLALVLARGQRERMVAASLTRLGARIEWRPGLFADRVAAVRLGPYGEHGASAGSRAQCIDDVRLRELVPLLEELAELKTLAIESDLVTDDGLRRLCRLKQLAVLDLRCPLATSDSGDRLLAAIPGLRIHDD